MLATPGLMLFSNGENYVILFFQNAVLGKMKFQEFGLVPWIHVKMRLTW